MQKTKGKKQKAQNKKRNAQSKKQKAKSKRQKAKGLPVHLPKFRRISAEIWESRKFSTAKLGDPIDSMIKANAEIV